MMRDLAQATITASALKPTDVIGLPYSPALLLDGHFDASITDSPDFASGCQWGFQSYADDMELCDEQGNCFLVDRYYEWREVEAFVVENVAIAYEYQQTPLPFCAAMVLGWLSALVLVQNNEALRGLSLLVMLVTHYQEQSWKEAA
ncbi:hypothetical protein [Ktedonobacter robiniae]|uniref:Uncharacterized protein n=1 Tax=Ktedonobacter robiniae TaxID=2778365 RepID=A0ABQ3UG56_9CHLR|nr:hypothetical protein [Ktedonobacter robiniae]GHO51698.1 hypothetical protein KSB_01730 [Ktedonobacter robiniae]